MPRTRPFLLAAGLLVAGLLATSALAQSPDSTGLVHLDQTEPVLIGGLAALRRGTVYPESARRDGLEGCVIVQSVVAADGTPTRIVVARGVRADLDSAAVAAVRLVRFVPGRMQDGRAVAARTSLPVTFAPFR